MCPCLTWLELFLEQWHTWYNSTVTSATSPQDERQQPQSVHPAAIWQQIQKYLLLYHQTTQQLHSSDCETPELIRNTHIIFQNRCSRSQTLFSFFTINVSCNFVTLYKLFYFMCCCQFTSVPAYLNSHLYSNSATTWAEISA